MSKWREYAASADGREEYRKWEEYRIQFENKTPEKVAGEIVAEHLAELTNGDPMQADAKLAKRIAAACEHFYEYGRAEPIDPQSDVRAFMAAFGQPLPDTPQWPDHKTMDLRVRLVAEEFCEWLRDSGFDYELAIATPSGWTYAKNAENRGPSLPKSADALIDLLYVAIGSLLAMGIDMCPLWREVHRANMAKAGGPVVDGKQMKPAGWTPPNIESLLRKQGWEGE